jgi:hypothetical protein
MTRPLTESEIREVIRIRRANRKSVTPWLAKLQQAVITRLRKEMREARKKEAAQ